MSLPAWMDAASGLNGERLLANSSEFTNWLHPSISGSSAYEAVVFPAPLHPDMTYSCGMAINIFVPVAGTPVADNIRRYGEFPVPAIARGGKRRVRWPGVRIKTFSAHVVVVFQPVVSGKRFSAHEESRDMVANLWNG